eukprot:1156368-Pelagomonas_calceolata.AAC.8
MWHGYSREQFEQLLHFQYTSASFCMLQLSCPRRQGCSRAVQQHGLNNSSLRRVVQTSLKMQSKDDKCWIAQLFSSP